MKANAQQFASLSPNYRCFFFYGANEGLIQQLRGQIEGQKPFDKHSFQADALVKDAGLFHERISSVSLFGDETLIRVSQVKDNFLPLLEAADLTQAGFYLILESTEPSDVQKLRRFCEDEDAILTIPCYEDDVATIRGVIREWARANQCQISPAMMEHMSFTLGGDRQLILKELEKLLLLRGHQQNLGDDEIMQVLAQHEQTNLDAVFFGLTGGDLATFNRYLQSQSHDATLAHSLVRGLQRHFSRLHHARDLFDNGQKSDLTKAVYPPVFFKYKDMFDRQVRFWRLPDLEKMMNFLLELDVKMKRQAYDLQIMAQELNKIGLYALRLARM